MGNDQHVNAFDALEITSHTEPLALNNLPKGNVWEADGACWQAEIDPRLPNGWRWRPMNLKAFWRRKPRGEMTDFYPIVGGLPKPKE